MTLTERIKDKACELGFDLLGMAPAARAPHADAFGTWVEAGYAADMGYLSRNVERRQDPRNVLPGAQSVVVAGFSYFTTQPPVEFWDDPSRGRIARFAWGPDYHDVLIPKFRQLADFIANESGKEVKHRVYVDTGPMLERDWAVQAGLGFIGKNTNLINPRIGSFLFLGEILLNRELEFDNPLPEATSSSGDPTASNPGEAQSRVKPIPRKEGRCGSCTRCLDHCPTSALRAPYTLDSKRCISYLTIELKNAIPEELRPLTGNWIFGCDDCQTVCPWPRRFSQPNPAPFLEFDPNRCAPRLLDLIQLSEAEYRSRFAGTPVLRSKRKGLLRNVAVALGNWGNSEAIPALEQACQDHEPLIRKHASWALVQIRDRFQG